MAPTARVLSVFAGSHITGLEPVHENVGPEGCMVETNVAFAGRGSWIFTFSAVFGPRFVMATVKLKSWAESGAAPFNDLLSERSADGAAACTVNGTLASRLPPPE